MVCGVSCVPQLLISGGGVYFKQNCFFRISCVRTSKMLMKHICESLMLVALLCVKCPRL